MAVCVSARGPATRAAPPPTSHASAPAGGRQPRAAGSTPPSRAGRARLSQGRNRWRGLRACTLSPLRNRSRRPRTSSISSFAAKSARRTRSTREPGPASRPSGSLWSKSGSRLSPSAASNSTPLEMLRRRVLLVDHCRRSFNVCAAAGPVSPAPTTALHTSYRPRVERIPPYVTPPARPTSIRCPCDIGPSQRLPDNPREVALCTQVPGRCPLTHLSRRDSVLTVRNGRDRPTEHVMRLTEVFASNFRCFPEGIPLRWSPRAPASVCSRAKTTPASPPSSTRSASCSGHAATTTAATRDFHLPAGAARANKLVLRCSFDSLTDDERAAFLEWCSIDAAGTFRLHVSLRAGWLNRRVESSERSTSIGPAKLVMDQRCRPPPRIPAGAMPSTTPEMPRPS